MRELSELQYKVDREITNNKKRQAKAEEELREILEPFNSHQFGLRTMLTAFLRKNAVHVNKMHRKYRFGVITFERGRLKLKLHPVMAGALMGKP
ncbi:MAG: hypothetical protein ACYS6W_01305 [Planctomycetota bacterium]|jgi:hypothetical protein